MGDWICCGYFLAALLSSTKVPPINKRINLLVYAIIGLYDLADFQLIFTT